VLSLDVLPNGTFTSSPPDTKDVSLQDISEHFFKENVKDIGVETDTIKIKNCSVTGEVDHDGESYEVSFVGKISINNKQRTSTTIRVFVSKVKDQPVKIYAIMDFVDAVPKDILEAIMNKKSKHVTFFDHLISTSSLFDAKKREFGITLSYTEVYFFEENSVSSRVLDATLQSNIPVGVTVLFPVMSGRRSNDLTDDVNLAFVINAPVFDLLIDESSRISVNEILPIISKEFTTSKRKDELPKFIKDLHNAYTTHVSFDSSLSHFYVFVRLKVTVELVPKLLRIKATNLVLHKNVKELGTKEGNWKISAKGTYNIGDSKFNVQYTELDDTDSKTEEEFGLTGHSDELSLNDVIEEYNPYFYPDNQTRLMIENTEIETLKLHDIKLFSRVQGNGGRPHILLTGLANIPQWERDIQVAMLILRKSTHWDVKWAMTFKHSPLTNIIEALTGFEAEEIPFLHNGHIMTTLISSPLENMSKLPPHVITTPLLRLPVKKGLTVISLLKFPDSCGDDKICGAATQLLDENKVYTTKGVLSTNGFTLSATIMDDLEFSDQLKGVNNSLRFTISNSSRMDILTSLRLPEIGLVFEGPIHIYKTGKTVLQLSTNSKKWIAPFGIRTISIRNLKLVSEYSDENSLKKLDLEGTVNLGLQGNGAEIEAPVHLAYNSEAPLLSSFYANFSSISLESILEAFTIDVALPEVLEESRFPTGLMLTYSGKHKLTSDYQLHGDLDIFGRSLYCAVAVNHPGSIKIVTENSPAPIIYASGLIIVQESRKSKLRGPNIVARITHKKASVIMKGFVKLLGIESEAELLLHDTGIEFEVEGKIMEYKNTKLKATSKGSPDTFKVRNTINTTGSNGIRHWQTRGSYQRLWYLSIQIFTNFENFDQIREIKYA